MAQQTAVSWLAEQLKKQGFLYDLDIEAAKQMEKEKLINFHIEVMKKGITSEGQRKWTEYLQSIIKEEAEQYYKETFGGQGSPDTTSSPTK